MTYSCLLQLEQEEDGDAAEVTWGQSLVSSSQHALSPIEQRISKKSTRLQG
jgi:hypothetical protein